MKTQLIYPARPRTSLAFLFYFLLVTSLAFSQTCPTPNSTFSVTSTDALCLGSGTVTISTVTGGSGNYEYQLVNSTNSGLNKPWQSSSSFTSVSSGSYQVQVRSTCTTGTTIYSPVVTQPITVGGNYETLDLSVSTTPTCSTDGTITTTASKGYLSPGNGYRYALVPSLTEPEPINNYVRPQQSSNVFSNLAPGTYYVRVYDDCSSYASYRTIQAIVLSQVIPAPQVYINRFLDGCDSEFFYISTGLSEVTQGSLVFVYPDGSEELLTLGRPDSIRITLAKFGTGNPASPFSIKYTDPCGNTTTSSYMYDELDYELSSFSSPGTCGTTNIIPFLRPYSTLWPNASINGIFTYTYSVDGGPSQTFTTNNSGISGWGPLLNFPNDGSVHSVTIAVCGETYTISLTAPNAQTDLGIKIFERNANACEGRSGMALVAANTVPITVHFTSVPAGQTIPPDQSSTIILFDNLLPGSYSFTVTNGCLIENKTFVLDHPLQHSIEVIEGIRCDEGQSGIDINIATEFYASPGNLISIQTQQYTTQVFDSNDNFVTSQVSSLDYLSANHSLSNHFVLGPGTYKIVVNKSPGCNLHEQTITILGNQPITLNQLLATSFCPTQGFTVVQASGGVGPYQYTLYENAIALNNKLAGPQPGNAFTGLDPNKTYFVAATDECGAGINIQTQFSTVPLTTALNADSKDCLGESVQLEVYSLPGASYQWYKNNSIIPGATSSNYQIPVLTTADLGVYKVFVTVGTCDDFTTDLELTGHNCSPYPVRLSSFSAKKEGTIALVAWSTSFEENSDHFEIQHSTNGRTWQTAGSISAKGSASSGINYSFNHTSPVNGINYYRLKMVDKDGTFALSTIRSIRLELGTELIVYPNPTTDKVTIKSSEVAQISSVTVFDLTGNQLLSTSVSKDGTANLKQLPAGSYILKINYVTGAYATEKIKIIR